MLRALFILIPSLLLACSKNQPAPVAPAGKVADFDDFFDFFLDQQSTEPEPASSDTAIVDSAAVSDDLFNIALVFPVALDQEKQNWIREVASQWEPFFADMTDTTISDGTAIDDIRITIQVRPLQNTSNWSGIDILGEAEVVSFRHNGSVPLTATITIDDQAIETRARQGRNDTERAILRELWWKHTFQHELGHALGIGPSPAWKNNIVWQGNYAYYTGINGVHEYQASGLNDLAWIVSYPGGIAVESQSIGGRKPPIHWTLLSGMDFTFFDAYFLRENDLPNVSRISLGTFEDIGWRVNYEMGMETFPSQHGDGTSVIYPCWLMREQGPSPFHLCPPYDAEPEQEQLDSGPQYSPKRIARHVDWCGTK